MKTRLGKMLAASVAATVLIMPGGAGAADAAAAEALARQESCLKCHAIDKDKSAPSYKKIAAKYKEESGAEELLITHVKAGKSVTLADGDEESHRIIKTNDEKQIRNLIQWILSR